MGVVNFISIKLLKKKMFTKACAGSRKQRQNTTPTQPARLPSQGRRSPGLERAGPLRELQVTAPGRLGKADQRGRYRLQVRKGSDLRPCGGQRGAGGPGAEQRAGPTRGLQADRTGTPGPPRGLRVASTGTTQGKHTIHAHTGRWCPSPQPPPPRTTYGPDLAGDASPLCLELSRSATSSQSLRPEEPADRRSTKSRKSRQCPPSSTSSASRAGTLTGPKIP